MARTTIKDIAKRLGISPSTVSRALKDHPDISEKTKELVRKVAAELKYRPNALAQKLRTKQSNLIGVIIPQIVHYFFSSIISGIEDYAYEKGYTVIIAQSNEKYQRELKNVEVLLDSGVDGILISRTKETTDFSHFQEIIKNEIPIVFFDRTCPSIDVDRVVVNDEIAAYRATKYLIETGCRRIVHFKGPENLVISTKRLRGYLEALREYRIPIDKKLVIKCDSFEDGQKITKNLLEQGVKFDAIFAVNDDSAAGAVLTLQKHGVKIPQEVSVFGYSNSLISRVIVPNLSTVEQRGYEMGYVAARMLIERIEGKARPKPRKEVVSTKLIIRETTRKLEKIDF